MLKHLFSLLFGISSLLNAMAVEEPAIIAPLEGRLGQLKTDSFAEVQDMDFYADLQRSSPKFEATNLKNIISFSMDEASGLVLKTPFQATLVYRLYFSFKNKPYEEDSLEENQTLVINYDTAQGKPFNAINSFVFENAVRVRVKIVSIKTNAVGWDPVPSLKLTNELRIDRQYIFNCGENKVAAISFTPPGTEGADELHVFWPAAEGADEYDLEWRYIDRSAYDAKVYGEPGSGGFEKNVFRNNAARVTLDNTTHDYNIPLFFEGGGWLIFRVRS
ncbi:MAG TPA: hypothetical protein VFV68_03025, partial [Agriterribacter sp.]|nr:hypothetical protein [Agriterribacter sp.]